MYECRVAASERHHMERYRLPTPARRLESKINEVTSGCCASATTDEIRRILVIRDEGDSASSSYQEDPF